MALNDDDVQRIASLLPFDERHRLTHVSKQFERVLSTRHELWDTDATFFIDDASIAESCVAWMSRRRHFRSLHIHFDLVDDVAFAAFLGCLTVVSRGLQILMIWAPHLKFEDPMFLGSCDSLLALHVDALSTKLSDFACRTLSKTLADLHLHSAGGTLFPLPSLEMSAMRSVSFSAGAEASASAWRVFEDGTRFPCIERVSLRAAPSSTIAYITKNLQSITSLSLKKCNLVELPIHLSALTSLKNLRVSHNSLASLENLPHTVTRLDVSHNCLVESDIGERTSIRILDMSCNPDISRPNAMILPNLQYLSCSSIPTHAFFVNSTQLRTLNIHARCRGYERDPQTPSLSMGLFTTATALFIEPNSRGFLGVDMCREMMALVRSNPHLDVLFS
jgi:hypothetical protein